MTRSQNCFKMWTSHSNGKNILSDVCAIFVGIGLRFSTVYASVSI